MSEQLDQNEVWVLKVGSSLVTAEGAGLNLSLLRAGRVILLI